jgi:kynurenine formamidase
MKHRYVAITTVILITALSSPLTSADKQNPRSGGTWIDLSHEFSEDALYWPTAQRFKKETEFEGPTDGGWYYSAYNISTSEHGGTHLDAPIHFAEGAQSSEEIPIDRLVGDAAVIDVTANAANDRDYLVTVDDLLAWEKQNGRLPDGAIVLINTGSAKLWPDAATYMGTDERGSDAVANLHFPGIHPDLATFLVEKRNIKAVGIDTPSIDYGQSTDFMTHRILFADNIPGFENVAALDSLPATGAFVVALPMKIRGGSGGPLRIIAWIPD